jgi:hypothetical protein
MNTPTNAVAGLQHRDQMAHVGKNSCRGKAGQSRAHDDNLFAGRCRPDGRGGEAGS